MRKGIALRNFIIFLLIAALVGMWWYCFAGGDKVIQPAYEVVKNTVQGAIADGQPAPQQEEDDDYIGEFAYVENEYVLFLGKQITAAINQLTSRLTGCQLVTFDDASRYSEKQEAQTSLETMRTIRDSVELLRPSQSSIQTKENVLEALDRTISHIEGYIKALEGGEDASSYATYFKTDINNLKSYVNTNTL